MRRYTFWSACVLSALLTGCAPQQPPVGFNCPPGTYPEYEDGGWECDRDDDDDLSFGRSKKRHGSSALSAPDGTTVRPKTVTKRSKQKKAGSTRRAKRRSSK